MTQQLIYRVAVPDDEAGILKVFEEVAPEVPTEVRAQTPELVRGWLATGASLVATDADGKVVGYALAEGDGADGISLIYLGVAKAARNRRVCSTIVSKLKEFGVPITAAVRHNNTSSMAERFQHLEFVESDVGESETKFRWDEQAAG